MKTNNEAAVETGVHGAPLMWLRLEGTAVFFLSILLYRQTGAVWWLFAVLLLVPDVSMAGYLLGARWGSYSYNAIHSYLAPLMLAAVAAVIGGQAAALLPYALIWTAHIGMDRALGYGLKYPSAFRATHLGALGARGR